MRLVLAASRGWALALGRLTALQINDLAWQMMEKIVQYLLTELERGKLHKNGGTNILIDTHWSGGFHCDDAICNVGARTRQTRDTALKALVELSSTESAF